MLRIALSAFATLAVLDAGAGGALGAPPQVVSTSPVANAMATAGTPVVVTFDQPLLPVSVTASTLRVFRKQTGRANGPIALSNGNRTVTLTPSQPFAAGELVLVNLANTVLGGDFSPVRSAGYAFQFLIATQPAARAFDPIQTQTNKTGAQTRIYGAAAADLDRDGWIDLTTVNEVSSDLRVFLNRGDGSGLYDSVLLPPFPIGLESSPNETADFDQDGKIDLAVSATQGDGVWIVRGAGNGTFSGSQVVPTGQDAHGVAVLDVDGDADLDIVDALAGGNQIAVLRNDGAGTFGSPTYFDSGCNGEWGLASGDLNGDGIVDLVVGCVGDGKIGVMLGDGDGTFTVLPSQNAGGSPWQVTLGDVDGDGDLDVTLANAFPGDGKGGALLIGNGDGTFGAPLRVDTGGHAPATDLGDLDGDGDLDWVLSGFVGGLWKVYVNDGAGNFTFDQEFAATANPSCAVLLDIDNDGDLDMALTDEIDDTVTILQNGGGPSPLCPPAPAVCRGSVLSGKSSLQLRDKTPDTGDQLVWKWAAGATTPKADYGAPLGGDAYAACLYDQGALIASVTAEGGGVCAGKPCWAEKPTGFLYKDKALTPTGAQTLQLVQGLTDGKARITLKAKGVPLAMPALGGLVGPIDVQLHRSGGAPCFGSTFSAPFLKSDGTTFKDRSD
jgi:hypothetical protein